MAIVLTGKLVFLEHPRTGSTAIRAAIRKIGGHTRKRHSLVQPVGLERTVATVRNPYDLLVSWWLVIKERTGSWKDFGRFLDEYDNPNMLRDGRLFYFEAYHLMRYETLQKDFNIVLSSARIRPVKLNRLNMTPGKLSYKSYYTPETIAIVKDRFAEDLEEYGYGF